MLQLLRQRELIRLLLGSKYIGALNITSLVYLLHPLFRLVLNSEELNTEEPYFVVTAICCQVWLATGSDLGGSLRTPASFCGVVGLRPSVGRVPQGNSLHQPAAKGKLQLHAVSGPMARNVPDLALFLDAMAHQHPKSVSQSSKDMLGVPALGVSFSLWVLFHCSLSSPLPPPPLRHPTPTLPLSAAAQVLSLPTNSLKNCILVPSISVLVPRHQILLLFTCMRSDGTCDRPF